MRLPARPARLLAALALAGALLAAGCGEDGGDAKNGAGSRGVSVDAAIAEARSVEAGDFEPPGGRTLQEIADELPAIDVGLATSVYTPGENRLAFGMLDKAQRFVYGRTAVYLARRPDGKASGPFPAPADPIVVEPPFRSRGAAEATGDIAAIYDARIELPQAGRWFVLAVTHSQGKRFGAATEIEVTERDPIPDVGDPAPRVQTDTLTSAGGDIESIDTRVPPSDLHESSFADVVGERPAALLFATPQLCQTRVCGPVTDIAVALERTYGEGMEFIHQEVYVDNDVEQGLRSPLRAFELRTEPWLFTVDADGLVAARLEGSFGVEAFERAVRAAL